MKKAKKAIKKTKKPKGRVAGIGEWRREIIARDRACRNCGLTQNLTAHHICNYKDYPELRLTLSNGAALCVECHKLFHKLFGKTKTTKEQFEVFLGGYVNN
jgi:5-methylcytosine-specific restriction endonuclease McrA